MMYVQIDGVLLITFIWEVSWEWDANIKDDGVW